MGSEMCIRDRLYLGDVAFNVDDPVPGFGDFDNLRRSLLQQIASNPAVRAGWAGDGVTSTVNRA